jgi:hypothetical protein
LWTSDNRGLLCPGAVVEYDDAHGTEKRERALRVNGAAKGGRDRCGIIECRAFRCSKVSHDQTARIAALGNSAPEIDLNSVDPFLDLREALDIDSIDFLNFITAIHRRLELNILALASLKA